jgi:hypothetical protein
VSEVGDVTVSIDSDSWKTHQVYGVRYIHDAGSSGRNSECFNHKAEEAGCISRHDD